MPAISQYIKALSSSGGHQKLVLKGPSFPKKGEITRGGSGGAAIITNSAVAERREALETYLQELVRVLNWSVEPNLRSFLECDRWLRERRTAPR